MTEPSAFPARYPIDPLSKALLTHAIAAMQLKQNNAPPFSSSCLYIVQQDDFEGSPFGLPAAYEGQDNVERSLWQTPPQP
jgi:hypothetical protein